MTSIYRRALGSDFDRLHPQIQKRFGFSSSDNLACRCTGVMEELWHGPFWTLPFLYVGSFRRIMFPERGKNVPFTLRNYAYIDKFGRETVAWLREFQTKRPRQFDAYMIFSEQRGKVVDFLGTHQHLAVDCDLLVDERGGLCLRSGAQRFYEGFIGFTFPSLFSGDADVREWFDESIGKFRISVNVSNKTWGPLFGYHGTFDVEWIPIPPGSLPADIKPIREERRE